QTSRGSARHRASNGPRVQLQADFAYLGFRRLSKQSPPSARRSGPPVAGRGISVSRHRGIGRLTDRLEDVRLLVTLNDEVARKAALSAREGVVHQHVSARDLALELDHAGTARRY